MDFRIGLVVPTLNAASLFSEFVDGVQRQSQVPHRRLVVDSESVDATTDLFKQVGFEVHSIPGSNFNHGGTRQLAVELLHDVEIIVFLTQDAILANDDALDNILRCFENPRIGAAFGRQLPRQTATPIEAHARFFNYPAVSRYRTIEDIPRMGIRAAFLSNSFAAYRRSALFDVGGFPRDVIFGEDTQVAAKMLLQNWQTAYCAEATVYHSHNHRLSQEFKRYFDIGVFHSREKWFLSALGTASGEGWNYVKSDLKYLGSKSPGSIPSSLLRNCLKMLGYQLGKQENRIPVSLKQHLSMNKGYWRPKDTVASH